MGAGALDPTKILGIEYFLKYKRGLEDGQLKKEEHLSTIFPKDYSCEHNHNSIIIEVDVEGSIDSRVMNL